MTGIQNHATRGDPAKWYTGSGKLLTLFKAGKWVDTARGRNRSILCRWVSDVLVLFAQTDALKDGYYGLPKFESQMTVFSLDIK